MKRRGFLFGLLAAPAVPVVIKTAEALPAQDYPEVTGHWSFATYGDYIFVTDSEGFHRYNGHEWLTDALDKAHT